MKVLVKKINNHFPGNLELLTEDGDCNFAAYLMSDINNISLKVAKYKGLNRVDLSENNEYGYCSLVKATNQLLDKIELENRTFAKITSRQREENRLWNAIALRVAAINAIIHNDFSDEIPPKFEIFADRIEITSAGGLPNGFTRKEFFEGYSVPRNKEIMRIFKDLKLVEHLGSGIPRILESYGRECFIFSENFLRVSFPSLERVTPQVKQVAKAIMGEMSRKELQNVLGLSDKRNFVEKYLSPSLESKILEMTIPAKPTSRLQKYRLTKIGLLLKSIVKNKYR